MFELFKKFGIPATVAAVISAMIAILPFLFKLDERYAKASELDEAIQKVDVKVNALNAEVGKLTGITQVLVAVAGQGDKPEPAAKPVTSEIGSTAAVPRVKPLVIEKVEVPVVPVDATHGDKATALRQAQQALEASKRNIEQIQKY